jgi:hypothetical protein
MITWATHSSKLLLHPTPRSKKFPALRIMLVNMVLHHRILLDLAIYVVATNASLPFHGMCHKRKATSDKALRYSPPTTPDIACHRTFRILSFLVLVALEHDTRLVFRWSTKEQLRRVRVLLRLHTLGIFQSLIKFSAEPHFCHDEDGDGHSTIKLFPAFDSGATASHCSSMHRWLFAGSSFTDLNAMDVLLFQQQAF